MSNTLLVTILALVAATSAEPLLFNAPLFASPYTSAAYVNPYVSPTAGYVSPAAAYVSPTARLVAPVSPALPAGVPTVSAAVPSYPGVPYSSVSAYSYGSSYSVQDYLPVVNANAPLAYSAAYSLPYAYAADYFYRR